MKSEIEQEIIYWKKREAEERKMYRLFKFKEMEAVEQMSQALLDMATALREMTDAMEGK